ncbi:MULTISPECIES: hypothetical protein [Nocardiopsis]|uniref:Uncharacterized protein n=1 Tax=Nocardiopsis sinuspersici TaxID=501010 RepID=A0A1V3BVD2_9ACTN|nr:MULTISPECIES: hypothetical protein [Nocardiopsis]OOC52455.1 hypothetical protein NOSIN_00230 [Nocardiopsis sinuspersici]
MKRRDITLSDAIRDQMAALPPRVRIRAGEALLALAAADDPDVLAQPHPDYDDEFVRRMSGLGYNMTLLVYSHRVVALDVRSD